MEVSEIVGNIIRTHPDGQRFATNAGFTDFAANLEASADDLDLADYIIQLHKLFSYIKDGHTAVLSLNMDAEPFVLRTPILVQPFADGLYVLEAKDEAMPILGGRISSVNGVPIEQVLEAYIDGAQGGNPAFAMRWSPFLFAFPGWLHGLGFADGPYDSAISVEVINHSGESVTVELLPREGANVDRVRINRNPSPVEEMSSSENSSNFVRPLPDRNALYVSLDTMGNTDTKSFDVFASETKTALENPVVERIIIDLRRNGGGNNMLPEPLRRVLVKSRLNRPGGIFVLTSPRTFSAAMNLATRLERETYALFVGEPTGGRPNHFGDAKFLTAPASGVNYLISTVRWQDSMPFDDRIWLLPDVSAPPTFEDYLLGRDSALEAALSYESGEASDNEFTAMPWTRPSQKTDWRFFFEQKSNGVSGPAE